MSNASRCQATAARYEKLAQAAADPSAAKSYHELARLWLAMAEPAQRFDGGDTDARTRIFHMIDAVQEERRKVA